jgi:hypothetical protein
LGPKASRAQIARPVRSLIPLTSLSLLHPSSHRQRQTRPADLQRSQARGIGKGSEDDLPQLVAALIHGGHLGRRSHRRPRRDLPLRRQGSTITESPGPTCLIGCFLPRIESLCTVASHVYDSLLVPALDLDSWYRCVIAGLRTLDLVGV